MKNLFTQQNNPPQQPRSGITTTSEEGNEGLRSIFLNAVGVKLAINCFKKSRALLRQARSKIKTHFYSLGAPPEKNRSQTGFTLIETIVAMTILLISITGIMNLIHQGSLSARLQADQITANYLAAEAIEFIRARRDSYWLEGAENDFESWFLGSGDSQSCLNGCQIDARVGHEDIQDCRGNCDRLNFNESTGEYGHQSGPGWEESRFTRTVTMTGVENEGTWDEVPITVTVSWQTAGAPDRSITLEQSIYDYGNRNN